MLEAHAWASSHVGLVRTRNEDRCHVGEWQSGPAGGVWRGILRNVPIHAAVADGMGGHTHGDIASSIAIDCVAALAPAADDDGKIVAMIEAANHRIFETMGDARIYPAMGTTIVGMVIHGTVGIAYNVGDSRAYALSDGRLERISRDHTPGGSSGASRSHALTQSLGGTPIRMRLVPHIVHFDASAIDAILLCSDGLSDMVDDERMASLIETHREEPTAALLDAALVAGGRDNVTAILIRFGRR